MKSQAAVAKVAGDHYEWQGYLVMLVEVVTQVVNLKIPIHFFLSFFLYFLYFIKYGSRQEREEKMTINNDTDKFVYSRLVCMEWCLLSEDLIPALFPLI